MFAKNERNIFTSHHHELELITDMHNETPSIIIITESIASI